MSARTLATILALAALSMGNAMAAPDSTPIYGRQLMTQQERIEFRNKMRTLKTPEERQAFRLEHHQKMQERAKEKGVTLPDMPPAGGPGMRQGTGGPGYQGGRGAQ